MLKSMIVILAMFGSLSVQASPGRIPITAVQDSKAVGAFYVSDYPAIQDQKAVGAFYASDYPAVQDSKAVTPA